jgi:tetratricopeptide (TPR) repeat protein
MEEAVALFEHGQNADAFAMAGAARLYRITAPQARNLLRDISQRVRHVVREAYLQGNPQAVADTATGAEDIFIGIPKTVVVVARSLASLGREAEALELLKKGQAASPDSFVLRRWTGRFAALQGDYATALRMYASLNRSDPEFATVSAEVDRFFAGVERRALKQLRELFEADRSIDAFDLAEAIKDHTDGGAAADRELARKHRNLRLRLIEIEGGEGDLEERESLLRLMVRIKPDDASALRRLALECMRQFRFAEAAECWERLCALTPSNESVIRNHERCQVLARRNVGSIAEAAA